MTGKIEARFAGRFGAMALDVAFSVPATGVTALFGRSGSGKTTILRCLAGLERVPGTLHVEDETWQDAHRFVPPERRSVGLVFQGTNLLPHLDVRANLAFAARRAIAPLAVDEVATRTGISPLLDRAPTRLSGGELQRVAIARALLIRPRMLLLDEPLSALDTIGKSELATYLAELLPQLGMPVFYVSHDAEEVARLAHRQILLESGRVTEVAEIRRSPDIPHPAAA